MPSLSAVLLFYRIFIPRLLAS